MYPAKFKEIFFELAGHSSVPNSPTRAAFAATNFSTGTGVKR